MAASFGTSGLRGLATELLGGPAARHASAFLAHLLAGGAISPGDAVYLGRDRRASSPALAAEIASAVAQMGLVAIDCGEIATPALALHAIGRASAAIMITGSHIPADRNGVKFYRPDGEVTKADEAAIAAGAAMQLPPAQAVSARGDGGEAWDGYARRCRGLAAPDALAGWRIGIWRHSSVMADMLENLVSSLGATAVGLMESDGFTPVDTEAPDPAVLAELAQLARAHRLDAILSTDADADRPLILDAEGRQVRGDVAGIITARFLAARSIVTPVTSNSGALRIDGARCVLTKVGSPFVIAAMQELIGGGGTRVCGFEANGGFLLGDGFSLNGAPLSRLMTRDSVLPMIAVLVSARSAGLGVAQFVSGLSLPFATGDRLQDIPQAKGAALVARLADDADARATFLSGIGIAAVIDRTDGLRMTLADGAILHLRPSGNAPEMRCYAEAADEAAARHLLARALERLRAALA